MTDLNIIQTNRLILREAPVDELEQILAGAEPTGQSWAPGYPFEGTIGGAKLLIRSVEVGTHRPGFGLYQVVERESGLIIGDVGCHAAPDPQGSVEIGYGLVKAYRGRGYATEAARALVAWLLSRPEVSEVVAETEHDHVPSLAVLRNAGFVQVGTDKGTVRFRLTGAPA